MSSNINLKNPFVLAVIIIVLYGASVLIQLYVQDNAGRAVDWFMDHF